VPPISTGPVGIADVLRHGGRLGMANWTPEGFVGQMFKTIGKYVPPPAGVKPPSAWGTQARLDEMFGASAAAIRATSKNFVFRYRSPSHFIEVFRTYYGPMNKTFAALEGEKQTAFARDLMELLERMNKSGDATLVLPAEYLEIVIEKKK
jgi:hypothetical protein